MTDPQTIGDHIRKTRRLRRLSRKEVAKILGVSGDTVKYWEGNRTSPTVTLMPKVIGLLGYVPFADMDGMPDGQKIQTCRKILGLTTEAAANMLGISVSTLSSWENGEDIKKDVYWTVLNPFITSAVNSYAPSRGHVNE